MTENEKLRQLLREARTRLLQTFGYGLDIDGNLSSRIDKALAGSVEGGCESCGDKTYRELLDDNERVRKERDQARAEVEMLRGVGCQTFDKAGEEPSGPCGVCQKCVFRQGAIVMRDWAAALVGSDTALLQTYRNLLEGRIRSLPLPNSKERP